MKVLHTSLDVRGCLTNWKVGEMAGMFRHDDGRVMSGAEARANLVAALADGKFFLPVGGACNNFDYVNGGCRGHTESGGARGPERTDCLVSR